MGSMTRRVKRRMDEVQRVMDNQHRSPIKEYRKREAKVEDRKAKAKGVVQGLLHALGHVTREPPAPVIRFDRYHANIGARGTTVSAPNLRERDAYFAAKRLAEGELKVRS